MKFRCKMCGKVVELPISEVQYKKFRSSGKFVQEFFPNLTADQRELLISGICGKCFDNMFVDEDEDEDEDEEEA